MSDALPLPPRPNLEQYKKLAKEFQAANQSTEPGAIRDWMARWAVNLARLQSIEITPEVQRRIDCEAERTEQRWRRYKENNEKAARGTLADAQFFIARAHGFASWPKFVEHLNACQQPSSEVMQFEEAVDAIVSGDAAALSQLLATNPELVHARSTRSHHSTLLHYVSANGVEDFRQKTPPNIVEITRLLLEAGADVNAESDAYGGRSTTLGLTATSCHPEQAGVQLPLMELLIERGAVIDGPDGGSAVNGCLHNGRGSAAEFFARHGARLDLEGAAGVGRLDVVQSFFGADGHLRPPATVEQMKDGFAWACEFGRTEVIDFLLHKGMAIDAKFRHDGQTGLHWAALGGHPEAVRLLLERGAPVDAKDESYDGTALGWALYGWGGAAGGGAEDRRYCDVVAQLARAGATLDPEWYTDDEDRRRAVRKLNSHPAMQAALRGEEHIPIQE